VTEGHYRRSPGVGVISATDDDSGETIIYLAPLPDGPALVLRGSAAAIWTAVTDTPASSSEIATRVARQRRLPLELVCADVADFLETLADRGMLVRGPLP